MAGDEQQIAVGGHEMLVMTEDFAQAALGLVAFRGGADGGGRGDDANPRMIQRGGFCSGTRSRGRISIAAPPPNGERAAFQAAAVFAHTTNITLAAQVLLRAKAHGSGGRRTPATRPFRRR